MKNEGCDDYDSEPRRGHAKSKIDAIANTHKEEEGRVNEGCCREDHGSRACSIERLLYVVEFKAVDVDEDRGHQGGDEAYLGCNH